MNHFDSFKGWISGNPGKAAGVLTGAVFGILVLTIGALKTILILLFIFLGYLIGKLKDDNTSISTILSGLFRRK